jgi:hypothetical protein
MTNRPKNKGRAAEHAVVKLHTDLGVAAKRVPLSGVLGGEFSDDVDLPYGKGEVKARKGGEGWKTLAKWMKACPVMFLKEDRKPPLVVLTWDLYANLVQRAYGATVEAP